MTRRAKGWGGTVPRPRRSHMGRPIAAVARCLVLVVALLLLGGCAYYEQIIGNAETYYDAKVETWFKAACTLNQGALGRVTKHRRSVVSAACPPRTEPTVVPEPKMVGAGG